VDPQELKYEIRKNQSLVDIDVRLSIKSKKQDVDPLTTHTVRITARIAISGQYISAS